MEGTLIGIGLMAQRSGLTVSALRFYDGAGVLEPAAVDRSTGYRWYLPDQVPRARLIAQLRRVSMPLPEIRQVVAAADVAEVSRVIEGYLHRLEHTIAEVKDVLSTVPHALDDLEEPMPPTATPPAPHLHSGKVRDIYDAGEGRLLVVASDRLSAFDHVLPTGIPDKGAVLTQLSLWWFEQLSDVAPNHVISAGPDAQSMLCHRLEMLPVECVVRGYLTGSGLEEYERAGTVGGFRVPPGLVAGSRLPEPVLTPTTKAPMGSHDEALSLARLAEAIGSQRVAELQELSLRVYRRAAEIAEGAGILVADTKLEFGIDADGRLVLADELVTPDSSRLWLADAWAPGRPQTCLDKQYVRDWLLEESGWDRVGPPPALPAEVVAGTRARYVEALTRLTGRPFTA